MVSADGLPTAQIDGVAWSQVVIGNKVYVGGRFNNARPAGAAAGTQLTARGNLMAYDITTGVLDTAFAPSVNGQVLSVAASPDGTRIYAVGDFTTANGTARRRVAAFNASNGALITTFNPVGVSSQARAVVATGSTVYVGGGFQGAGSTPRSNLAAFRASDGGLVNWNPGADYTVWALALAPDASAVFAGGSFQNVGGVASYGLAKIDAATGAVLPWNAQTTVRNAGPDAGITSLKVSNGNVYGTTWHFGPGGNLEGTFKAPVSTGDVEWVTDCHGDNYDSFVQNGVVYSAGHAHYCGNMGGGFPQYMTWRFQNAQAWTEAAGGEILNDAHGYPNWGGVARAPSMINWTPVLTQGTFTGQGQAAWSVTGNNDYVAYGGEFPRVNGGNQQGLVRFAKRSIAPKAQGPRFTNNQILPTLVPTSPTSVRVSWLAGFDYDDYSLRYDVFRSGVSQARYTTNANSNWWTMPSLGFVDTGLTPGATYSYRIAVRDADNHVVNGGSVSVTMPTTVPTNAYADRVRADGARIYWPLNEPAVPTPQQVRVTDRAGVSDGLADNGVTWNQPGAIPGDTAARLTTENEWSRIAAQGIETAPDTFTTQAWFRADSGARGRILGFGDLQVGNSGHRDRQIYMNDAGQLVFGVRAPDGSARTVSSARSYTDGQWHQVTATMSASGMQLYVDGIRVGNRSDTTAGEAYLGHWRVGGDNMGGWPSAPGNANFIGDVDEVAIYPTALTQAQIIGQYELSGRTSPIPPAPGDAYGAAVYADEPDLYWRFGEAGGTTATDSGRTLNDGTYRNGVALGQPGVLSGNTAAAFDGADDFASSNAAFSNPTVYSEEAWFKTTSSSGGKIVGFGNGQTGSSGSYDRHVYMQDNGQLVFGTYTGQLNTITSPTAYNDGQWHHVVATQSGSGMKLYVDGELLGTNPQTAAEPYTGYWKVGGDNTWGSSSAYLNGTIDEVAIYSYELPVARVQDHFVKGGGALNQAPTASFTSSAQQRRVSFDASASTDADGTITSYAWDFGNGRTGTGATAQQVFAAGTYTVTLTVTDNRGGTGSTTRSVTVTAPPAPGDAYGNAVVADNPELFWRLGETSGTTAADASGALNTGTYYNGVTLGAPGALASGGTAADFNGAGQFVSSDAAYVNPSVYSQEAWFSTTSTSGGKIIGFGNNRTGSSGSYDRHVYMQDSGQLVFGTWTGQMNTITSPSAYNDGQWHHVVATQSGSGMKLYVDGTLVGTNPQIAAEPYVGHWKVGGDTTWGSSSPYLDGTIDEVAVYLTELSGARVAAHFAAASPSLNQPPTADFAGSSNGLTVSLDASTSSDADGTIAGYAWDFGDGTTGTGASVTHTYDEAGTYTITLTVTDDDGATDTFVREATVTAPPPTNQAPTAVFTSSVTDLTASLNASTSSDGDGTIAGYAWDFGDGTTGTGATVTHPYEDAGTYTVTLTVTDDDGATDTDTQPVTVTEPAVQAVARDGFGRTVTGGFGPAEVGGNWTVSNATRSAVDGAAATMTLAAGVGPAAYLNTVSAADVDAVVDLSFDKPGTGGGIFGSLITRRIGTSDYRLKVRVMATSVTTYLVRTVNGTETTLATQTISGLTYQPGQVLHLRLRVAGTGTTTLQGKVWVDAQPEPAAWTLSATDTTAALQAPGGVGLYTYMSGSGTNAPVVARWDDMNVIPAG